MKKGTESSNRRILNRKDSVYVASADREQERVRNRGIWARFVHTCKEAHLPYVWLAIYIAALVLQGYILISIPYVSGNFFTGDVSVETVTLFIVLELVSEVVVQGELYLNHVIRYRMNRNMRNALWGKILRLKPSYYEKVAPGTLLSRITTDADAINEFVMGVVIDGMYQIYILVLSVIAMSRISIRAGLMLMVFSPITFLVTFISGRLNLRFQSNMTYSRSDLTNYVSEIISCMPLMKAFNMQTYERRRGRKVIDEYYRQNRNILWLGIGRGLVGTVIGLAPTACIFIMGIQMLKDGTIDAAGWYTFYLYAGTFISFCSTAAMYWENLKTVQGKLNKISDVLYEEEEAVSSYADQVKKEACRDNQPQSADAPSHTEQVDVMSYADIRFEHVTFAYEENPVLCDVSFTIPAGKTTVMIGYSGSGKSTILKLLERIYEPTEGKILKGGREIGSYDVKEWRADIACVPQDTPLMSGSIRENILYGIRRPVDDEEIWQAAARTRLEGFIRSCPDGLDYQVGQFGGNLSGGQKQKISITRALLTGAKTLILDEPTTSLDIPSTMEIAEIIRSLRGQCTVLIVTHDVRLVRDADHIVAITREHTASSGSPEDMRRTCDFYNRFLEEQEVEADGKA